MNDVASVGVMENFSKMIDDVYATCASVSVNRHFSTSGIRDIAGSFVYIDQYMQTLGSLNSDFCKLTFYSAQSDLMYSNAINSSEYYFKHIANTPNTPLEESLSTITTTTWLPMEPAVLDGRQTHITTLLQPIEVSYTNGMCKSMLLFYVDINWMKQFLNAVTTVYGAHAILYYNDEPILSDSYDFFTEASMTRLHDVPAEQSFSNVDYTISASDVMGDIQIVTFVPTRYVAKTALDILMIYFWSFLGTFAFGLGLIFIGTRYNYKPISMLVKKLSEMNVEVPPSLNEVETVSYVMDNLLIGNQQITADNRELKLNRLLLRLINGSNEYSSSESFKNRCSEIGIHFDYSYFCCFVISFGCNDVKFNHTFTADGYAIYSTESIENDSYSCILCTDTQDLGLIDSFIAELPTVLETVGIGTFVECINDITHSYQTAYCDQLSGEQQGDTINDYELISQFTKEIELFYRSIINKDKSKIIFSVHNVISLILLNPSQKSTDMILQTLTFFCIKAFNTTALSEASLMTDFLGTIPRACDVNTAVIWLEKFQCEILYQMGNLQESSSILEYKKDIDYLLLYINTNFARPDFSIKALADEQNMSVSNLSHFFKSRQKINISEYINQVRINEAKRLLLETDTLIADIVPRIGYSHVSSFTKMFKASEGITPSEYKLINKKDKQ